MDPSKIKIIIFDFDGVLSKDNTIEVFNKFSSHLGGISFYDKMIASKQFYECMMGNISFTEFKIRLAEMASTTTEIADDIASELMNTRVLDNSVLNVITKLRESGFVIALHSDMMKVPFDMWVRKFNLKNYFNHLICSAYLGTLKNNPETYDKIMEFLNCKPQEILYIDDNSANIYTAKKKEIYGIVFRDAESLLKELGNLKIIEN